MAKPNLTAERVRELLHYDQNTGFLFWKVKRQGPAKIGSKAGNQRPDKYVVIEIDGRKYLAHRLAWLYVYGEWPTLHIDHIDGDPSNNRISNLRNVTVSINRQNIREGFGVSKLLGVRRNGKQWQASITIDGIYHYLGTFKTPESAHNRYLQAKREIHKGCTI